MGETLKINRFLQPTPWFTPDLPADGQIAQRNSWKVELLLESKEIRYHTPTKGVSA